LASIRFAGPDAAAFLHNQLSTDVEGMAVGAAGWTSYNSPKGRMLASPLLWRRGEAEFIAYVPREIVEPLRKRLGMFVLRAKVTVEPGTSRIVEGIVGPDATVNAAFGHAPSRGHGAVLSGADVVALPDGRYLVDGDHAVAIDGGEAAPSHWAWLGVRAGVPQIVRATQDLFIPQAVNFDLVGGINFKKGCYPGQEIVARMQYLGRLKERMFAFHVEGEAPAPGTRVVAGESPGTVVNAASAPGGGSELLAVVSLAAVQSAALSLADGRAMTQIPLPYDIPAPSAPNRLKL
jgi:folate-binding protein YgfZ